MLSWCCQAASNDISQNYPLIFGVFTCLRKVIIWEVKLKNEEDLANEDNTKNKNNPKIISTSKLEHLDKAEYASTD